MKKPPKVSKSMFSEYDWDSIGHSELTKACKRFESSVERASEQLSSSLSDVVNKIVREQVTKATQEWVDSLYSNKEDIWVEVDWKNRKNQPGLSLYLHLDDKTQLVDDQYSLIFRSETERTIFFKQLMEDLMARSSIDKNEEYVNTKVKP